MQLNIENVNCKIEDVVYMHNISSNTHFKIDTQPSVR